MRFILNLRKDESNFNKKVLFVDALNRGLSDVAVLWALLIMCSFYVVFGIGVLTVDKIYSSMLVFNVVRLYGIQYFGTGLVYLVNLRATADRVSDIL
jgi:hypothetical protein